MSILEVEATLETGKEPGTTDIVVTVEDRLPVHLTVNYDNFRTESVSKNKFGMKLNSGRFLLVEGASLSLRGVIGSNPQNSRTLALTSIGHEHRLELNRFR